MHQIIADTRPARMGPRLHFPERSDIAETRLYASRYLGQARRNGIRVYRHSATRLREALELRCGPIPLIDLDQAEEWIAGLPEDNRERLRAERNAVVAAWRRAFPLLPGERIIRDGMTALADPWQGNDAHTLVYSRRTDLGELAVVAQGTHIDLDTGDYVWTHPASRATSRPSLSAVEAFGVGGATVDMVEECISTFSTIMAACGPEGQVVGAVALVLNTILKVAFPETQVNLPTVIDQIVKQDLAQHNIEQDMTRLLAYTAWMKHQAQDAIANHYDYQQGQEYDETLQNIKDTIEHALDPSNPLLQSISDLQYGKYPCEPEFQIMALPVFLQGVSIHLLFLQTAILLSNNATTFKTSRTESLVNTAKDYLQHLQTQLDTISSRYEHRMACRTSQIYDFSYSECSGGMCTDEKVVYFIDLYGSEYPQRDTIEMHGWANIAGWERCGHAKGGGFDCPDMKPAQAEYFAQLDADFRTHYNFGAKRESDLREAMNMLQGIIDTYSPMVSA
ncbi:hypothetical protein [Thermocatellispora tengchongensis]|uniref:hypothetical protein n=1 Tax=Thermocatellispora tengchongensis TaxID=1073253 RepID=UPI00363A5B31